MTELIKEQLMIQAVMFSCGICGGMLHDIFQSFHSLRKYKKWIKCIIDTTFFLCLGMMYSEFSFYCDNGKLTFLGIFSFLSGLWLWRRTFCGILFMGEDNEKSKEMENK